MTPHCSRAVSTRFLSENILRMLQDRDPESQQHQWGGGRETKRQEGKEEVGEGRWSRCRKWLKGAAGAAAVSLFHGDLAVLVHLQLQLCVAATGDNGADCHQSFLKRRKKCARTHAHLRLEEEGVPRCILGKYVCCQSEQLVCPNLEKHTGMIKLSVCLVG